MGGTVNQVTARSVVVSRGTLQIELVMREQLSTVGHAAPPARFATTRVTLGRCENGSAWTLPLSGRHTLTVGCSGAGKGSVFWGIAGGLGPAVAADVVRLVGIDLKYGIELSVGAGLFTKIATTEADAVEILAALEELMNERGNAMAGRTREHDPTKASPLVVLLIDELAGVTAYMSDPALRKAAAASLSRILTKGRALGIVVAAFLQDPRGIRKRTNAAGQPRYQVRYLIRDPDAPSGWVETSATFPTLREAKAFKSERDNEAALGARRFDPRLGRTPLQRIWTQFSDSKKPAVSPKTWSGYTQHWELRISPWFGHVPVDEITRADVQAFVANLSVGPWAKVSTLRLLRSILDVAHQDGRIHRNPALDVSAGRIPERERHRYLTAQEVQILATACGDQGDVVTVLAYTGLRWSELVGLRVKDIDLVARRLYVRRAAPEVEGRIVVGPPKTRAGIRTVPLPQVVVAIFTRRIYGRAPDEPAVTSPNGVMLRSNNWRRHTHWNKVLKKTCLAPLTIHELRHTYASLARKSGADLRYVQKTMGHSTPTVTANIYSDLYADELDHVATNLDQLHAPEIQPPTTGQEPDETNQPPSA